LFSEQKNAFLGTVSKMIWSYLDDVWALLLSFKGLLFEPSLDGLINVEN